MKKLNKKGFTLVELLAVIVILALLIVVVANTALPAMNTAKQKSLNTYGARVAEKAKESCMTNQLSNVADASTDPGYQCTYTDINDIMGGTQDQYALNGTVTVTVTASSTTVAGKVKDSKNTDLTEYDLAG